MSSADPPIEIIDVDGDPEINSKLPPKGQGSVNSNPASTSHKLPKLKIVIPKRVVQAQISHKVMEKYGYYYRSDPPELSCYTWPVDKQIKIFGPEKKGLSDFTPPSVQFGKLIRQVVFQRFQELENVFEVMGRQTGSIDKKRNILHFMKTTRTYVTALLALVRFIEQNKNMHSWMALIMKWHEMDAKCVSVERSLYECDLAGLKNPREAQWDVVTSLRMLSINKGNLLELWPTCLTENFELSERDILELRRDLNKSLRHKILDYGLARLKSLGWTILDVSAGALTVCLKETFASLKFSVKMTLNSALEWRVLDIEETSDLGPSRSVTMAQKNHWIYLMIQKLKKNENIFEELKLVLESWWLQQRILIELYDAGVITMNKGLLPGIFISLKYESPKSITLHETKKLFYVEIFVFGRYSVRLKPVKNVLSLEVEGPEDWMPTDVRSQFVDLILKASVDSRQLLNNVLCLIKITIYKYLLSLQDFSSRSRNSSIAVSSHSSSGEVDLLKRLENLQKEISSGNEESVDVWMKDFTLTLDNICPLTGLYRFRGKLFGSIEEVRNVAKKAKIEDFLKGLIRKKRPDLVSLHLLSVISKYLFEPIESLVIWHFSSTDKTPSLMKTGLNWYFLWTKNQGRLFCLGVRSSSIDSSLAINLTFILQSEQQSVASEGDTWRQIYRVLLTHHILPRDNLSVNWIEENCVRIHMTSSQQTFWSHLTFTVSSQDLRIKFEEIRFESHIASFLVTFLEDCLKERLSNYPYCPSFIEDLEGFLRTLQCQSQFYLQFTQLTVSPSWNVSWQELDVLSLGLGPYRWTLNIEPSHLVSLKAVREDTKQIGIAFDLLTNYYSYLLHENFTIFPLLQHADMASILESFVFFRNEIFGPLSNLLEFSIIPKEPQGYPMVGIFYRPFQMGCLLTFLPKRCKGDTRSAYIAISEGHLVQPSSFTNPMILWDHFLRACPTGLFKRGTIFIKFENGNPVVLKALVLHFWNIHKH